MKKQLIQRIGLVGSTLGLALYHASATYASTGIGELDAVDLNSARGTFGFDSLSDAVNTLVTIIFFVAGLVAFLFILWGAVNYIMAGDDASKTEAARKRITNAVVGLILVALVYVIWLIAAQIFGIEGLLTGGGGGGT